MTSKQINGLFEKHPDEHGEFERIPKAERLHPSKRLCGLLKVASLMKSPAKFDLAADHDQIWLADRQELKPLTEADIIYLLRCGIWLDTDNDSLSSFA